MLNWWDAHKQEFLRMFKVACDFLLILRLEVDVKQLFNIIKEILALRQTLISVETLRALILLNVTRAILVTRGCGGTLLFCKILN